MDVETLTELLQETAERHHAFELAAPAHDWFEWYAPYLLARIEGRTPEEASASAGQYLAGVQRRAAE